jgi:hypothetical protein
MDSQTHPNRPASRRALTLGFCAFLIIAAYFLWTEHRAHLVGVLPWLLLLACPIIHLFMHRGHGGHGADDGGGRRERDRLDVPAHARHRHEEGGVR